MHGVNIATSATAAKDFLIGVSLLRWALNDRKQLHQNETFEQKSRGRGHSKCGMELQRSSAAGAEKLFRKFPWLRDTEGAYHPGTNPYRKSARVQLGMTARGKGMRGRARD